MELDVQHLRFVATIAESGTLSKAAIALRVSQPAVSSQLNRIEARIGCRLFHRHGGLVRPTPMCELLLRHINAVLPLMDELARDVEQRLSEHTPVSTVRVGAVCSALVGRPLHDLIAAVLPEAQVLARIDTDVGQLLDLVGQRRLELAAIKSYPGFDLALPDGVATSGFVLEPTVAVLPEWHRLADRDVIELTELRNEDWVLHSADSSRFHEYLFDTCARLGFTPRITHQCDDPYATLLIVRGGAVGFGQAGATSSDRGVVTRVLADNALARWHALAWRPDGVLGEYSTDLLKAAADAYHQATTTASTRNGPD